MLLWSTRVTVAVFLVFLSLEATEIVLSVGFFTDTESIVKAGGIVGVVTALVAWYASAAGVVNGMAARHVLPVGGPMWKDRVDPSLGTELLAEAPYPRQRISS
jgi:hypothetical protein